MNNKKEEILIKKYVNNLKKLIKLERDFEKRFHIEEIKKLGNKREQVGRAILNLKGTYLKSYLGYIIVRFGRSKEINTEISIGDVVLISKGDPLKSDLYGTVVKIGKNYIDVAFEKEPPKWIYKENIRIDLFINDITFKRMLETLDIILEKKPKIVKIILGLYNPKIKNEDISINFVDNALNFSQKEAVEKAILSEDLYLIHGPPGTGKTRTITEIIYLESKILKHKVLATAESNIAVDNIILYLIKKYTDLKIVRIGNPSRIHPDLIKYSLNYLIEKHPKYKEILKIKEEIENLKNKRDSYTKPIQKWRRGLSDYEILKYASEERIIRGIPIKRMKEMAKWIKYNLKIEKLYKRLESIKQDIINEIIDNSDVIVSTNSMAGSEFLKDKTFDVVIIDEGSQATEPSSLIPAIKGKKVIFAGDHKQLPPTVLSGNRELQISLFEKLIKKYPNFSSILRIQYRMNEKIMEFPNKYFYNNKIIAADIVKNINILDLINKETIKIEDKDIINSNPIQFININGTELKDIYSKSYYNVKEAIKILEIVKKLIKYKIPVSIISPYEAQVRYIKNLLDRNNIKDIEVKTIDGFQGRENEVIILSLVRSKNFGFLKDYRRLNVAITRAKRKLIIIGNEKLLKKDKLYSKLLDYIKKISSK